MGWQIDSLDKFKILMEKFWVGFFICLAATVAVILYDKKVIKPVKKEQEDAKRTKYK